MFEYNGVVRSQFAQWLRDQEPDGFEVTPVIHAVLVARGWTPPARDAVSYVSLDEMATLHADAFEVGEP